MDSAMLVLADWMPRGSCGFWPAWLMIAYIAANLGIFAAYMALPIQLGKSLKSGWRFGTKTQTLLWAAFIFLCGCGHLIENVGAFWLANYYVFTAWHILTALVSLYTAATFPRAMAKVLKEVRQLRAEVLRLAEIKAA